MEAVTAPKDAEALLDRAAGSSGEGTLKLAGGVSLTFAGDSLIVKGILTMLPSLLLI